VSRAGRSRARRPGSGGWERSGGRAGGVAGLAGLSLGGAGRSAILTEGAGLSYTRRIDRRVATGG
jgi:hypothetical protein